MQKNATRTHATQHGSGWCMRGAAPSRALALHLGGGGLPRMWAVATRGRLWAWAVETRGRADGDGADRAPLSRAFSPPKVTPATRAALATAAEATVCTADQRHQTAARDHSKQLGELAAARPRGGSRRSTQEARLEATFGEIMGRDAGGRRRSGIPGCPPCSLILRTAPSNLKSTAPRNRPSADTPMPVLHDKNATPPESALCVPVSCNTKRRRGLTVANTQARRGKLQGGKKGGREERGEKGGREEGRREEREGEEGERKKERREGKREGERREEGGEGRREGRGGKKGGERGGRERREGGERREEGTFYVLQTKPQTPPCPVTPLLTPLPPALLSVTPLPPPTTCLQRRQRLRDELVPRRARLSGLCSGREVLVQG
ncbi:hypothetical protein C7M84_011306 [Penaeus vannamei]|uniref:Uncharacterized protein n=1 Tax=Penaeus vannamei TaxID=6689 RepID=A0A3R7PLL1_PENVA|nr:hypothetical protein C7M84_011306 [Penaeus vannamei]